MGAFTATEGAAAGSFFVLIAALILVGIKKANVPEALSSTAGVTAMVFVILAGSLLFAELVALSYMPNHVAEFIAELHLNRWGIMGGFVFMYVVLGCFMTATAMMVITLPIVLPIVNGLGFDLIWFGIIMCKLCELALITPPVGMNLYAVKAVAGDAIEFGELIKGVFPFIVMDILLLAILIAFPTLSTIVPSMMK